MDAMCFTVQDCCCQAVHPFYQTILGIVRQAFDDPNHADHYRSLTRLWAGRYHKVLRIAHDGFHQKMEMKVSCSQCDICTWYSDEMRLCRQIAKGCDDGFLPIPIHRHGEGGEAVPLPLERLVHDRDCPNSRRWEEVCRIDRELGSGSCYRCPHCK